MALDPRIAAMRSDRQSSLRRVARALLVRADRETLQSRPTRPLIAQMAGVCERTVTYRLKDLAELGYLTVIEAGTTARIRAGRCYPAPDPYADEENRAQVYQLSVPACLLDQVTETTPEHVEQTRVSAGHSQTCAPSSLVVRPGRKSSTAHVVTTETTTRARGSNRHPAAGKAEKSRAPAQQSKPATPQPWQACADQVSAVWRAFPAEMVELLAGHEAPRIANAIAAELTHRAVEQLTERITRHWAYWRFKLAAGLVRSPAAIAFRLVRRDFDCPDVRCEDRWHLDLDAPCKACDLKAKEINTERCAERGLLPRHTTPCRAPAAHAAVKRPYDVPVAAPKADRCDPNEEFRLARQALRRQLGGATVRAAAGRQAIA